DNFVLGIAGLRFHHRIQELTPHGRSATSRSGFRIRGPDARGHHGHGHLTPRNAQYRCCTLARRLSKRRYGHHKKALLTHGCCARAASGHAAAAPPSAASNFRRPIVTVIRPSRARCVRATIPRHERAVLTARHLARVGPTLGAGCNRAPPDPTQLPAKKAHSCDRHHIRNAIAELVIYSSIVPPLCGSSDVPPTPQPRSRGAVFRDFLCREPPNSGGHHVTESGTISRFPHLLC